MDGVDFERRVLETVKASEERGEPPLVWAMELGRYLQEKGLGLPNLELGQMLVSNLCFANNTPSLWKLLDQALASRLLSPLHTLALLTSRVIPHRQVQPEAYRLYLELLSRYFLSFTSMGPDPWGEKITKSVDNALQLSRIYGIHTMDLGNAVVLFLFSVIICLIDSTLEDWGFQLASIGKPNSLYIGVGHQDMDIDAGGDSNNKRNEHREKLRRRNAAMAIEVVEKITANKKAKPLLRVVHLNMPEKFNCLLQRLQFIEVQKTTSQNLISAYNILERLSMNIKRTMDGEFQLNKHQLIGVLIGVGSSGLTSCCSSGAGQAACWVSFDIFMENAMDGKHLYPTSAIDILTALTKTLQVINQASWQETFQALWISALRLVQRDREPVEGPIPHLNARLCVLLSITPLAIAGVIKEDDDMPSLTNSISSRNMGTDYEHCIEGNGYVSRRHGLISSLQLLGQFTGLLLPPPSVVISANNAAIKAASFISNFKNGNDGFNGISHSDTSTKAAGNMLHLIVEACIARKLIDTSAYFWSGYVVASTMPSPESLSVHESPWSSFMEGAQLTGPLKNALITTPASSVVQVDKLYSIALYGSEEERAVAAKILCGASLSRGWNIQEYVVHFVVKLLSPPVTSDFSGSGSHLFGYMSMLNSILRGASCIDIVHIISLYGMVPEVAAALMPLCEAFGLLSPPSNYRSSTGDEPSVYSVFSCAFLFLLRLWKFYRPPQEICIAGRGGTVGGELTLDYLLQMWNSRVASHNYTSVDRINRTSDGLDTSPVQPVYIASFPKLRAWYFQNQACIASTLPGLCSGNPVHQIANKILNMIFRKMTKVGIVSGNPSSTSSGSTSGSPVNTEEDANLRPLFPAWEVLEAIPFVLEAVLTACAHGRLSSRDLTTGLRDLVDFLPASLGSIISYFSAEITRGIWKPVPMNGIDWPSPASNLFSIESEIKEILASAGVHVPSCYDGGTTPVMLPLPMAALVSLTITFKLEKNLEYIHGVAGPALENCATGCAWPSMPVIGALWARKVPRWHSFIVVSCSRSPFKQDQEAVAQLLGSCFASFLGPSFNSSSHIVPQQGVNGLLGDAITYHDAKLPIAPGFLYLRSCRTFHDIHFVNDEILRLVIRYARELATGWTCSGPSRLSSTQASLASASARAKEVATLGASLLCIAGGVRLVQVLYEETMLTWLLTAREGKPCSVSAASRILEGYAMAYMVILSGSLVWGVGDVCPAYTSGCKARRARAFGIHMDFVAEVLEGNISLGCDPATWKAYVSCCVGLVVHLVPAWVTEVKQETLRKLANGLRGWHECELALALLERGGPAAITSVMELVL